ncbi:MULTISPECIES: CGEA protein [Bacillus cereus group]|uniref:CGEA protein n=2 Tax=Bacillus cereus group TaxID=86661 RepID=A0ABX5DME8_9BACI|nr:MULTISPECIES: CGEA protein [Bacillus cereus group]MBF7150778.1 CGEA protein [Bacillus toyonensis]MEC2349803.1 CGEA protein [Bacillus toyonensis]MED3189089.1 CGEA protein [Bacillus toyonensis]PRT33766.1 CGEA protein [Bacillus wiedmannii]
MANCTGIACFLFTYWPIGTVVTITTRSGQIIGPAILQQFFPTLCIVILEEEGSITPESTIYTFISCEDIESVSLTS